MRGDDVSSPWFCEHQATQHCYEMLHTYTNHGGFPVIPVALRMKRNLSAEAMAIHEHFHECEEGVDTLEADAHTIAPQQNDSFMNIDDCEQHRKT